MTEELVVANFNIHAGVDGWARPFDVTTACRELDADVIIMEENAVIEPTGSVASRIADELGYTAIESDFSAVELLEPFAPVPDDGTWGPTGFRPSRRALRYPDGGVAPWRRTTALERKLASQPIGLGLAILVRVPHTATRHPLPSLMGEPVSRTAIILEIPLGDGTVRVVGTHLGHLTHGSPRQMVALARLIADGRPTVVAGDMNAWGPIVAAMVRGTRRAVVGPTWPAWRPRHQIDHILVTSGLSTSAPSISRPFGSDHLALRCTVRLEQSVAMFDDVKGR